MDLLKSTACLEISSDAAKLAVGSVVSGEPVLLYSARKPLKTPLVKGNIGEPKNVVEVIRTFFNSEDPALALKLNIQTISMVLPPIGFKVYQSAKTTNVIASNGLIDKIDISNVMSLVRKDKDSLPTGSGIVDIVPDYFVLSNANVTKPYDNPPLGEHGDSLTVKAKMHTLSNNIIYDYKTCAESAGFRVKRCCVATYCAAELLATDKRLPETYFYLDLGGRITTLSIIARHSPIASLFVSEGGDQLSESIATSLGISYEDAKRLKENRGYDERTTRFQTPVIQKKNPDGTVTSYYQKDLNAAIAAFYAGADKDHPGFDALLANGLASLIAKQPFPDQLKNLPIVLGGGASTLNHLDGLLPLAFAGHAVIHYVPRVIGARDPSFINLLGLIVADGSYKGTLEDDYHGVSTLSRDR